MGFSFRCVGFRIYAFPILDDISYFCADSAGEKPSLLLMMVMMMRLYYCCFMAFAYTCMHNINVCGLLHWLPPPPTMLLLHMCAFSVSVCLGDYQLIVLRICLADFSFYLSVCLSVLLSPLYRIHPLSHLAISSVRRLSRFKLVCFAANCSDWLNAALPGQLNSLSNVYGNFHLMNSQIFLLSSDKFL